MRWIHLQHEGAILRLAVVHTQAGIVLGYPGGSALLTPAQRPQAARRAGPTEAAVRAPMTGRVVAVEVDVGQSVAAGDLLVVLEAMKMEYRLSAPKAGRVVRLHCAAGGLVDLGDVLVELS